MPQRIQRKRTKGYRLPEGAIYVGRPTKWGNPFAVGQFTIDHRGEMVIPLNAKQCLKFYRAHIERLAKNDPKFLVALRGHDLACFCPIDQPCHADVLLELANAETEP